MRLRVAIFVVLAALACASSALASNPVAGARKVAIVRAEGLNATVRQIGRCFNVRSVRSDGIGWAASSIKLIMPLTRFDRECGGIKSRTPDGLQIWQPDAAIYELTDDGWLERFSFDPDDAGYQIHNARRAGVPPRVFKALVTEKLLGTPVHYP